MDKLLDKGIHQLFKSPSLTTYLSGTKSSHRPKATGATTPSVTPTSATAPPRQSALSPPLGGPSGAGGMSSVKEDEPSDAPPGEGLHPAPTPRPMDGGKMWEERAVQKLDYLNLEQKFPTTASSAGARPKTTCITR